MKPDFLVIGASKCGTTSLYNYLIQHPSVLPARKKEIHYFDLFYGCGDAWYQSQFQFRKPLRHEVTGEASPYYIFHPHAPGRIANALPRVRLIALLRNPIERAYSHYQHVVRLGYETLPFADAIAAEDERLDGEVEKMLADETYYSFNHQYYSYLTRGIYADQFLRLQEVGFAPEQILVLKSEDFFARPLEALARVWRFLELPDDSPPNLQQFNVGRYEKMPAVMRDHLREFYQSHNGRLRDLLGAPFNWD